MKTRAFILTVMLQAVLTLLAGGVLASCSDDIDPMDGPGHHDMLYLRLNVGVPETSRTRGSASATRAQNEPDYYSPVSNNEKISTLRVIIARPDGSVEANTCVNVAYLEQVRTDLYKVKAEEQKTIYVIANEPEEFSAVLGSYQPGTDDTPGKPVDEALTEYVLDQPALDGTARPIPMSAVYRMAVYNSMDSNNDETVDLIPQIRLLRAATKFTIDVTNNLSSGSSLRVSGVRINSVADREYLFGHVSDLSGGMLLHSMTIGRTGTVLETATGKAPVVSGGDQTPDDMSYTDHYHDTYQLAEGVSHQAYSVSPGAGASYLEVAPGATKGFPSFYACESMPAGGGAQPFTITLEVADGAGRPMGTFTKPLPNLPRLPRNTHVVVHVNMNMATLECNVFVEPYVGVTLNPLFGINVPRLRLVNDQGGIIGDKSAYNREVVVPPGSMLYFKAYDETNADVTDKIIVQQEDPSSGGGWEFIFEKTGTLPANVTTDHNRPGFLVLNALRPGAGTLTVRWVGTDGRLRSSALHVRIGDMRLLLDSYERYLPVDMPDNAGTEPGGIQYNKRKLTATLHESVVKVPGTKIQWSIGTSDGTCRFFTLQPAADGNSCQIIPKKDATGKNIAGTAMVVASYTMATNEVIKDSCRVSLIEPFIELEVPSRTFKVGEQFTLDYSLTPENYFSGDDEVVDNNIEWSSSNPAVAEVDPHTGQITTKSNGYAVIRVYTYIFGTDESGTGPRVWASAAVNVGETVTIHKKNNDVPLSYLEVTAGKTMPVLEARIDGVFHNNVTWKSSDESVLKVTRQTDGRVKLEVVSTKSQGGVFIYATSPAGTLGRVEVAIFGSKTSAQKRLTEK